MKKNILIVDDDYSFIREIMNSVNTGKTILSFADSVQRAGDMINYQKFDLIFANSNAPGGDILKLKERISDDGKIFFLSSNDSDYENLKKSGEFCFHKYDINGRFEELLSYV